ncbi:MAG: agmatine deiminase family protein [Wenzhouxiangella sp.]
MTFQQRFGASVLLLVFSLFLLPLPALAEQASVTRAQTPTAERTADPAPSGLRLADPRVLEQLRRQDAANPGLPRHLTARERRQWQPSELTLPAPESIPDYRFLRPQAEYERNDAILMRWGSFNAVLTSMIVPITTGDSRARVKLLVSGPSQQASAASSLNSAGADLSRVDFLQAPSDSVWIRDYGPRFASANFRPIIIDHDYDRPRPLDNQVPGQVASALNLPIYELPLAQGGGNYHSFANGEAFITDTIFYFNPSASADQVKNLFAAYQGVDMTILGTLGQGINGGFSFPWFDGTGHLDMWFLPVDDNTVIIGEYSPTEWNGIPHEVTEEAVAVMQERGYTVLRTPGWRTNGTHFTYTNAVIVNDIVLTCTFNGAATQNAQALATFEQAFPDRTIVPVNCSSIIGASGALHCIVKHKPASDAFGARPPYYGWGR